MKRKLSTTELSFLRMMLGGREERVQFDAPLHNCFVEEAEDGGMGGLKFQSNNKERVLGRELSSIEFEDDDGVKVIATINLDQYGDLFELDIWKTDFTPLLRMPTD